MSQNSTPFKKRAVLRDRLFVPGEFVTEAMLEEYKSEVVVGEAKSLIEDEEPEIIHETINHYQLHYVSNDSIVYSFNRGDLAKMYRLFHDFEITDERVMVPMGARLKIKFPPGKTWREYQPDAIDALMITEYGCLKAPPRSGKTLMMAATICAERQKTIIFAHQTDLLVQLYDTFCEFTNLLDLQTPGNQIVGFADTLEEFHRFDVVLCTKQTFDHITNKGMLPSVQLIFGSVWVDEAHFVSADMYSKLINRFWAKTRRGVTATDHRKDGLEVIANEIIGPTVHEITPAQVNQAPMEVFRINTGVKLASRNFTKILTTLARSKKRNELIVREMVEDVRAGHIVIAVTDRTEHQDILHEMLFAHGISSELFNGSTNNKALRKKTLNMIREKKTPVLLSMRSMTTGLDIPCADVFYNLLPSANAVEGGLHQGEGGYEQQCTRVRTDFPGKKKCYVKDFVDRFGISYACWNARRKTYDKIGAYIHRIQDDEPEQYSMLTMDDGLGGK